MAMPAYPPQSIVRIEDLRRELQSLVDASVKDRLPIILEAIVEEILAKQRKDVADELVRILLEKALEGRQTPKGFGR